MYNYNVRNLGIDFPQLINLECSDLCFILDDVFNNWLKQIPNSVVSDIQKLRKRNDFCDRDSAYICVIDGQIVNLKVSGYNVSSDEDEYCYKAEHISFSRDEVENKRSGSNFYYSSSNSPNKEDKDEIECKKLFETFNDFVKNKKLEELITDKYILNKTLSGPPAGTFVYI